ncbi:MAG: hypothetical protein ABIR88_08855 [Nitrospiria bacterium]
MVALVASGLAGCGGGGGGSGKATEPPPPVVAVMPAAVTVIKARTVTLSAVVFGAGPEVVWSVDGGLGGGSVDAQGVYQAPAVVPDHPVIVRATSVTDARGTGTAVVRVIVGDELTVGSNRSVRATAVTASTFSGGQRSVAVHGLTVYTVWTDRSGGDDDVYLAVSCDRGLTFGSPILVNDAGPAPQTAPTVAVDGAGRAVIAWIDGRDYFLSSPQAYDVYVAAARGPDCGSIAVGPNHLVARVGMSGDPSVALAVDWFGRMYLAWPDDGGGSTTATIWMTRGTPTMETGIAFAAPVPVSEVGTTYQTYQSRPAIAAGDDGNVVVAWNDSRSGTQDVYWRAGQFASTGTVKFGPEVRVNQQIEGDQISPSVALRNGTAYVAWGQQLGSERRRIYLASSAAAELAVHTNVPVVPDTLPADQNFPSLAVDADGGITIAFADNRNCLLGTTDSCASGGDGTGPTDVYVVRSLDGGATFREVQLNDDASAGSDQVQHGRPSVAVDDVGRAYAVWSDDRTDSPDLPRTSRPFMALAE